MNGYQFSRRIVFPEDAPLLWNTCFIQKQAVEEFNRPSRARWSSSVDEGGSLMTGALLLKTFPPRSSTKWL
jgi:hypothetical protein